MPGDDWFQDVVDRQFGGELSENERKEWRAQQELNRSARLTRRRVVLWLKYGGYATVFGGGLWQTPIGAWITKFIGLGKP